MIRGFERVDDITYQLERMSRAIQQKRFFSLQVYLIESSERLYKQRYDCCFATSCNEILFISFYCKEIRSYLAGFFSIETEANSMSVFSLQTFSLFVLVR